MTEWVTIECGKCGCFFQVSEKFNSDKRASKDIFYCPNGHRRAYVESEADKLRRERDRLTQRLAQKDDEIKELENRRRSAVGQITRMRNRIGRGVCPCCNRSFADLRRHIESKHPTFMAEAAE